MEKEIKYCVVFHNKDGFSERDEYYYNTYEDAAHHFNLFKNNFDPDYPDMYTSIQLLTLSGNLEMVSEEIRNN